MDKQSDGQSSHRSDDVIPNELYACDTSPASSQVDDSQPKSSQCVLPQELRMILDSALATTGSHTKIPPTRTIPDPDSSTSIDVVKPKQPVCAIEHVKPLNPEVQNSDDDDEQKKEVENKPRRRKRKNIFTRIDDLNEGPLFMLKMALVERRKIKVWIRSAVHVRSICSGFVQLFDKHMNLAMSDVDETFINPLLVQRKEIRVMPKKKKKKRCPPGTWIPVRGMNEGNPEPHDDNQQYFIQTNFSEDDQSSEVQHWALRGIDEGSTPQSQEDLQGHSSSAISELPVENINPSLNLDGTCDSSSDEYSTDPLEQVQDLNDLEALAAKLKQELAECSDSSRQTTDSPVKHSTPDKHKDKYHHTKDKKCEGSERKDSGNKISGRHKESSSDHYRKSHRRDLSPHIDSAKHRENQEKSRVSGRKHKSSHSPERYHQSDVGRASKSRSSSSAHHSSSHREINVSLRERSRERCSDFDIHATFSHSSHSMSKGRSRESRSSSRTDITYVQADTSRGDSRARSVSLGSNDLRQKLLKRSIKYSLEADKEKLRSSNSTSDCRKSASQARADVSYKATHSKSKSYDDHSITVGYSKSKDLSDESKYTKSISRSRSKDKTNYSKDKSTSKHCEHKLNDYDDPKTKYQDSNSSKTQKYVSTKRHYKDTERGKGEKKSEKSERTDPSIHVTQVKDLSHELDESTKYVAEYKSKSNQKILRRFVSQLFIRGDNVVMVAFAD